MYYKPYNWYVTFLQYEIFSLTRESNIIISDIVKEDKPKVPDSVEDRETPPGFVLVRVVVTKTGKVIRSFVPRRKKK